MNTSMNLDNSQELSSFAGLVLGNNPQNSQSHHHHEDVETPNGDAKNTSNTSEIDD